ncbi:MAG: YfcE family phosphodiesterase [Deltaproteobacteria bacterium]|nr:YfcE family phosphodiesterase [Deltaproteobacteria bacterium]
MQKKILIISDSHGNTSRLTHILKTELPVDIIIHCGDGANDLDELNLPHTITLIRVNGNMDRCQPNSFPRIARETINTKKTIITHGDHFRVNEDCSLLLQQGQREGADLILFGHTHVAFHQPGPPILFNPGPANNGMYGIVTIIDNAITCRHHKI